ncbi:MAG TPA: D-glycerate dehydrogenase [Planktothrix sp.]|jgi:glyoxylate reductase
MTKPLLFITAKLIGDAPERLKERFDVRYRDNLHTVARQELLESARDTEALICYLEDKIDAEFMNACPALKVVANVAVGYDNVDVAEATRRGILVCNTPGVLTDATADMALALLLATARRLVEADRFVRDGQWTQWTVDLMLGWGLNDKTLGIIGMGRIGEAIAKRARAFGMRIIYTKKRNHPQDERYARELDAARVEMTELLRQSDFISINCPLNAETRHLIGEKEFAAMKPSCILINTARGAVIDEKALVKALTDRRIAAAGLDVFENEPDVAKELLAMKNVVVAPHIGSATFETRAAMANSAASAVLHAFAHELPANAVNKEAWSAAALSRK